jgi:hypothetical protein
VNVVGWFTAKPVKVVGEFGTPAPQSITICPTGLPNSSKHVGAAMTANPFTEGAGKVQVGGTSVTFTAMV